jgi:hypothetical protein
MEKCKFCNYEQTENDWMADIGLYDHGRTKYEDPEQYVECPGCHKILHVDYDILDENEENIDMD